MLPEKFIGYGVLVVLVDPGVYQALELPSDVMLELRNAFRKDPGATKSCHRIRQEEVIRVERALGQAAQVVEEVVFVINKDNFFVQDSLKDRLEQLGIAGRKLFEDDPWQQVTNMRSFYDHVVSEAVLLDQDLVLVQAAQVL